ncbi:amidase [Xylophilus sp. GW821-FHT01B05]
MTASTDITLLPAETLLALYARRELSPVEVVEQTFERIEALNGELRMFTWTDRANALAQARAAEAAYRSGAPTGALCGVPFSVKDTLAVRGAPQTFGSALFQGHVPDADNPVVERLRQAGAVFVGMANMPEFGQRPTGENALYGTARNPWSPAHTTGGSSSGSAAAVAVGASAISIGTDAGGSVRIPASCCGVLGIKATHGLLPSAELLDGFSSLVQIGPIARNVADLARTLDVIAGKHASDPWSYAVGPQRLRAGLQADGDLRPLRLLWLPATGADRRAPGLDPQVRALCEQALQGLAGLGASVEEGHMDLSASSPILGAIAGALNQHKFGGLLRERADGFPPSVRARLEAGAGITRQQLQQGLIDRTDYFRRVQTLFEQADVLVTPTLSAPPVLAQADPTAPLIVEGQALGPLRTAWIQRCHPFNVSGNPAITVPAGWTREGLPVGIQFVGPWYGEALLLKLAAELEALSPWAQRRPPVLDATTRRA